MSNQDDLTAQIPRTGFNQPITTASDDLPGSGQVETFPMGDAAKPPSLMGKPLADYGDDELMKHSRARRLMSEKTGRMFDSEMNRRGLAGWSAQPSQGGNDLMPPATSRAAGDAFGARQSTRAQPDNVVATPKRHTLVNDFDRYWAKNSEYMTKTIPRVVQTYLKQGKAAEAQKLVELMDTFEGRSYARKWTAAMKRFAVGDFGGALAHVEALYNDTSDGHVEVNPGRDGKTFNMKVFDANGTVTGEHTGTVDDVAKMAIFSLSPEKIVEHKLKSDETAAKNRFDLEKTSVLEDRRDARASAQEDRRDARYQAGQVGMEERLAMRLENSGARGGLSMPQQRQNDSIDAARRHLTGMTDADILKRTQSTTNTGRENPLYDSSLAAIVKMARTRKYGDDQAHDAFMSRSQQPQRQSASTNVSALPPGSRQIGTSNGRPVYQTPDGRRLVQE
ncbi:MAG: hypothetical protein IPG66_11825 [Hydrogenophilales bacterium]|nr:hypothetical protein [Hydrogenophilales bacterium]